MKIGSVKFTAGEDYTEFSRARVLDNVGFSTPIEAYSLLIPKNWAFDGRITWNAPGTRCAGTNHAVKAGSPDGRFSFQLYPNDLWSFTTDPELNQFKKSQPNEQNCWYGAPMNAAEYLRIVFAPRELGNPEIISVHTNTGGEQAMQENNAQAKQELMRYGASQVYFYPSAVYAKVKWSNGLEGIVLCGVNTVESIIPNIYNGSSSRSFTSITTERVVFTYPAAENAKAPNLLSAIMSSMRTNTAWKKAVDDFWLSVRQQSQTEHIGKIRMMDEQTRQMGEAVIRNGQQRLNDMDAGMRSWEASQQSQDRMHTSFIKAIREVETYRDETGRIELNAGYRHAWSRSDGSSFLMSDNPNFDPAAVFLDQQWKEMKKVD